MQWNFIININSYRIFRRRSYPLKLESESPIRFAVRSLGWVEIAEEDLTPEKSSKAVNKCIVDLSLGRNDLLDVVGRWGDVSIKCFIKYRPIIVLILLNAEIIVNRINNYFLW